MEIKISQAKLKAVALAMATKDIRPALNGVLLETTGEVARLVATDGVRVHIAFRAAEEGDLCETAQYILPAPLVTACCKARLDKWQHGFIGIRIEGGRATAMLPNGDITAGLIEGQFPNYRRVIPDSLGEHVAATYRAEYILDAYAGMRMVHPGAIMAMHQRGDSMGVLAHGDFFAGVMPLRSATCAPSSLPPGLSNAA